MEMAWVWAEGVVSAVKIAFGCFLAMRLFQKPTKDIAGALKRLQFLKLLKLLLWAVVYGIILFLGIWRENPRPFNDRDESAACFFQRLGLFQAWSFSGSEKRNCLKRKKQLQFG